MFKIKDRILLGTISGTASAFVGRIINRYSYSKGLTDIRYNPLAARLFLPENKTKNTPSILLGSIVNNINVAANGVFLTYLLSATGKDNAVLKGMGTGALSWILVDGLISGHVLKVKSKKPLSPAMHLFDHLLYGALCATLITRLGDDNLFPPESNVPKKRIPLVNTEMGQTVDSQKVDYNLK